MTQGWIARLATLAVVIAGAAFLSGCMSDANGAQEGKEEEKVKVPVEAATVEIGDVGAFYSGTATLEADHRATVVARSSGVILEVLAEEGDFVEKGQVLARLDTDRDEIELRRATAELKRLEMDFARKQELFQRELVSAEDFERVRADLEAQKAAHDLARLELEYAEIRAPFSGYIAERIVWVGNMVDSDAPAYRLTSYDPLLAVLHVPERELAVLRKGLPVSVAVDAFPDVEFRGEVVRISPVIDAETGTFRVTARVRDEQGLLKPGLFGRVQVQYDLREGVPVIPRSAIIAEDDRTHVFIVAEDNVAARREVRLGYERAGHVEVVEGLVPGDRVVTAGKGSLNDGSNVEVIGQGA